MRRQAHGLRGIGALTVVALLTAAPVAPSRAQSAPSRDDIVAKLKTFESAPDLDIAALRQRVLDKSRSRSRKEPDPDKRPLVVPEILNLPTFTVSVDFDSDTPVVRPSSYETVGRIADALVYADLLPYSFLIVGHSSKRVQTLGLGEEQFIDQAHPTSPVNLQVQIVTVAKLPEQSEQPAQASAPPAAKKKAKKR
jgi:OmpA-OmpF porin, OOP family